MEETLTFTRYLERTPVEIAYDECVKRVLSTKYLLAWILKGCVWEYKDVPIPDIVDKYIEGEPQISETPVHAGERIHGLDTADKSRDEHTTLYDILFYASLPGSTEKIGLFINVEAQNRYDPGYPLLKRGLYYSSRLLSAQFNRDFADGHYEKLKKVYSIWLCTNAPEERNNTITQYEMHEQYLLGHAEEKRENYDLLSVVLVCFNDRHTKELLESEATGAYSADLVRLLGILLSTKIPGTEKRQVLSDGYQVPMTRKLDEEVFRMCNLSQGVKEQGIEIGTERGIEIGTERGIEIGTERGIEIGTERGRALERDAMVVKMLQKQCSVQTIMEITDYPIERIQKLAEEHHISIVYNA